MKCDESSLVSEREIKRMAGKLGAMEIRCSAMERINVDEVFRKIVAISGTEPCRRGFCF